MVISTVLKSDLLQDYGRRLLHLSHFGVARCYITLQYNLTAECRGYAPRKYAPSVRYLLHMAGSDRM
jgi:hypothetical protein